MGHARCSFTCLISSTTNQRSGNLYCVVPTYRQHLRQEERHRQEAHPHCSCYHDFSTGCLGLQVTSMVLRGDAAAETTSSTIDEAFTDCALPTPPGRTPLWGPGSIPDMWADVCGFLKPPGSDRYWKVRTHGAFSIPRTALGLRPTDQSCHHETWLHLDFVDWRNTWEPQGEHSRHISLKERPASFHHGQQIRRMSEVTSDHSLSS